MRNNQNNIEQLLFACKSGDNRAQLYIYKQYYHSMFNTAYRLLQDKQEAEDLMQESFLIAFTKLDLYNGNYSFGTWLKKIVINKSISYLRSKKYFNEIFDDIFEIQDDKTPSTDTTEYKVKEVVEQMYLLKDKFRIPLSLNLLEGYDYDEIAEILNITNQNCRTIVSRAKSKLRNKLICKKN